MTEGTKKWDEETTSVTVPFRLTSWSPITSRYNLHEGVSG
jgi:hypothetical protein